MSAEAHPIFVDTNILVYAYDPSAGGKYERAHTLISGLWPKRAGCLSIQVLQEFYVTVTRKLVKPLDWEQAHSIVTDLREWTIHRPTVDSILSAIRIQARYGISFWDALILQSASELGCATVWSEDLSAGQVYEAVRIVNPFSPSPKR